MPARTNVKTITTGVPFNFEFLPEYNYKQTIFYLADEEVEIPRHACAICKGTGYKIVTFNRKKYEIVCPECGYDSDAVVIMELYKVKSSKVVGFRIFTDGSDRTTRVKYVLENNLVVDQSNCFNSKSLAQKEAANRNRKIKAEKGLK